MPVLDVEGMSLVKLVHGSITASRGTCFTFLLLEHLEVTVALGKVMKELRVVDKSAWRTWRGSEAI